MHPAVASTTTLSAVPTLLSGTTILRNHDRSIERIRVLRSLTTERCHENRTKIFMLEPDKGPIQTKPTRSTLYLSYNFLGSEDDPMLDTIWMSLSTAS